MTFTVGKTFVIYGEEGFAGARARESYSTEFVEGSSSVLELVADGVGVPPVRTQSGPSGALGPAVAKRASR